MKNKIELLFVFITFSLFVLNSCGKAYFPIELKTKDRSERLANQEMLGVQLVAMTEKSIRNANQSEYKRRIVDGSDLLKPAKIKALKQSVLEVLPPDDNIESYKIGPGDVVQWVGILNNNEYMAVFAVSGDGYVDLPGVGEIKVSGLTEEELRRKVDRIQNQKKGMGLSGMGLVNFKASLVGFNSKKIFITGENVVSQTIAFTPYPIFLEDVLVKLGLRKTTEVDYKIKIFRKNNIYEVSLAKMLTQNRKKIRLHADDRIHVAPLVYRQENVMIVGETGTQRSVAISSMRRPTLSEVILDGNSLISVTSDFSQIYVIRKTSRLKAYHLDITNPARILLANKFEMRPDDIIFVATQPLSLYSRTLSQILGSTGLTLQARDTIRNELGN